MISRSDAGIYTLHIILNYVFCSFLCILCPKYFLIAFLTDSLKLKKNQLHGWLFRGVGRDKKNLNWNHFWWYINVRVLNHLLQMIENDNKLFFKHLMHISKVCSFGQILLLIIFITVQNKKNSDKILFWKKQLGRGFILSTAIQLPFFTHTSLSIFIQRRTL